MFVACDDERVAEWAEAHGAQVSWGPGLGLNGAIDHGVDTIAGKGIDHVVVAHGDLPLAGRPRRPSPDPGSRDRPRPATRRHQRVEPTDVGSRSAPSTEPAASAATSTPRSRSGAPGERPARHPPVDRRRHDRRLPSSGGRTLAAERRHRHRRRTAHVNPNEPGQPRPVGDRAGGRRIGLVTSERRARRSVPTPTTSSSDAAATLAKWAAAGMRSSTTSCCTDGSKGTWDADADTAALAAATRGRAARGGAPARRRPRRLGRVPALRRRRARPGPDARRSCRPR